jgi:hypothetical protein
MGWLKAPQRAAEKAVVCYARDVSRVVDICRWDGWMLALNCLTLFCHPLMCTHVVVQDTLKSDQVLK